jgi:hypothetical protein
MKRSELILLILYSIACFAGISFHEIWLDEAHHWLLARDSASLSDLLSNMQYDGHPILWNILLFGVTRFTHNPIWMQTLHVTISIFAAYVFIRNAPFTLVQKYLFLMGYFILYEYTVISRNYSLILLLLFAVTVLHLKQKPPRILIGFLLAILANVHLFGCFIAIAFMLYILFTEYKRSGVWFGTINTVIGLSIFFIGVIICAIQVKPPEDSPFTSMYDTATFMDRIETVSSGFIKAFIPIPDFLSQQYWNTNLLIVHARPFAIIMTIILIFLPVILLGSKLVELLYFYMGAALVLLFIYVVGIASQRYFGILYILLIQAFWLAKSGNASMAAYQNNARFYFFETIKSRVLMALLLIQMVAGLITYSLDIRTPFSSGRQAATFLQSTFANDYEMITTHVAFPSLCSYTQKKMFVLNENKWESFIHWQRGFLEVPTSGEIVTKIKTYQAQSSSTVLLITDREFKIPAESKNMFSFLQKIGPGTVRTEVFYIYKINSFH